MAKNTLFGQSARLMAWENHILEFYGRCGSSTIKDAHIFLLNIYECTSDNITYRDAQRSTAYLEKLGYVKKTGKIFDITDSGSSFLLWTGHVDNLKQLYFFDAATAIQA